MFETSADDLILEKVIILYTFNNLREDVTDSQLTQIIMETDAMNYFTFRALLPKMLESKFITKYQSLDTDLYSITQSGLEVLVYFQNRIPEYFRNKILDYIVNHDEDIFSSKIVRQAKYSSQDDKYVVTLILNQNSRNLMTINANVDTEPDAKSMCDNWDKNYKEIMSLLKSTC